MSYKYVFLSHTKTNVDKYLKCFLQYLYNYFHRIVLFFEWAEYLTYELKKLTGYEGTHVFASIPRSLMCTIIFVNVGISIHYIGPMVNIAWIQKIVDESF